MAARRSHHQPRDYIQHFGVANDGKTALFEARGDVFWLRPTKNAPIDNLTRTAGTRERFPQISRTASTPPFSRTSPASTSFISSPSKTAANGPGSPRVLTKSVYHLEWSPDSTKILFSDKDFTLYYVDVATKRLVRIDSSNMLKNDEFTWESAITPGRPTASGSRTPSSNPTATARFPLQPEPSQELPADHRFLRQPLPQLRCQRRLPLLLFLS